MHTHYYACANVGGWLPSSLHTFDLRQRQLSSSFFSEQRMGLHAWERPVERFWPTAPRRLQSRNSKSGCRAGVPRRSRCRSLNEPYQQSNSPQAHTVLSSASPKWAAIGRTRTHRILPSEAVSHLDGEERPRAPQVKNYLFRRYLNYNCSALRISELKYRLCGSHRARA